MRNKTIFAIVLISLGVITAMLDIFVYRLSGGNLTVSLVLLGAAVACIITGTLLAFSRLLDRYISPMVAELNHDIEDDLEDIRHQRWNDPLIMLLVLGISVLLFAFLIFKFHKLEAMWGSIPVAVLTIIAVGILAFCIPQTDWFQNKQIHTPMWVFLVPAAGLILSVILGLGKTEDMRGFTAWNQEAVQYNTYRFGGTLFQTAGNLGIGLELPSCDGDACLAFYLVVALVILTVILVAGSAMFPHFWVFSGSILICLMALIAIHDLRIRPSENRHSEGTASEHP